LDIEKLATRWAINDGLPPSVDLIFPVAHGAVGISPSCGLRAVVEKTRFVLREYRHLAKQPVIASGAFTHSKNPHTEEYYKLSRFWLEDYHYVGLVASTIEEALLTRKLLPDGKNDPREIIIITDEAHSRRARIVWQKFFPKANIYVVSVTLWEVVEKESPMTFYRKTWRILIVNMILTFFWKLMPVRMMEMIAHTHQPTI
jgi:hypothetical protein